jgi:hypothetical protein
LCIHDGHIENLNHLLSLELPDGRVNVDVAGFTLDARENILALPSFRDYQTYRSITSKPVASSPMDFCKLRLTKRCRDSAVSTQGARKSRALQVSTMANLAGAMNISYARDPGAVWQETFRVAANRRATWPGLER